MDWNLDFRHIGGLVTAKKKGDYDIEQKVGAVGSVQWEVLQTTDDRRNVKLNEFRSGDGYNAESYGKVAEDTEGVAREIEVADLEMK